jgi:hypothetical protein
MPPASAAISSFSLAPADADVLAAMWKALLEDSTKAPPVAAWGSLPGGAQMAASPLLSQGEASGASANPTENGPASAAPVAANFAVTASSADKHASARTDSVYVFVQSAAVSIAVRDANLSPDEALRAAFETAHQLKGQRGALQRLTLNGQTLYSQASAGAAEVVPHARELTFSC